MRPCSPDGNCNDGSKVGGGDVAEEEGDVAADAERKVVNNMRADKVVRFLWYDRKSQI